MYESHLDIDTPPKDTKLWRYIDIEKLLTFLHTGRLHLSRLDSFRDPWEGAWPDPVIEAFKYSWGEDEGSNYVKLTSNLRKTHYVSCWHESAVESAALWDLYAGRAGVALHTTVGRLQESIQDPQPFKIGRVRYIDYQNERLANECIFLPVYLKRKSFEHEREVRVHAWVLPENMRQEECMPSVSLAVRPNDLIDGILVSPSAPDWLLNPLQELCMKFGVTKPVIKSSLYDPRIQ